MILIELFLLSLIYISVSSFLRIKFFSNDEFIKSNYRLQSLSKELKEAMANNNQKRVDELNKEAMLHMSRLLKSQFVFMLIIIPFYLLLWYYVLPIIQPNPNYLVNILGMSINYKYAFLLITFILGLIVGLFINIRDKKRRKELISKQQQQ